MKHATTAFLVSLACSGCSTPGRQTSEPHPLAVTAAVAGGAIVGAVATPLVIASGAPLRAKEEAQSKRRLLDPIYLARLEAIQALDPVGDAIRCFEARRIVYLPSVREGAFYPGLEQESWHPERHGLPSKESNWALVQGDPRLEEVMDLTSSAPQHQDIEKPPYYISEVYFSFQRAGAFYKATFNQAMYRRVQGQRPNKSPEPTLTVRPFSLMTAALETPSSLWVSVAHL
jgi:hypothetical protein